MSFDQFQGIKKRYGSFEVFAVPEEHDLRDEEGAPMAPGWYWWACIPGCLPDSEPFGPFETDREAYDDAQAGA